jgi:hypothetical protein
MQDIATGGLPLIGGSHDIHYDERRNSPALGGFQNHRKLTMLCIAAFRGHAH